MVRVGAGVDMFLLIFNDQVVQFSMAVLSDFVGGMTIGVWLKKFPATGQKFFNVLYIANSFERKQNCTLKRCFRDIDKRQFAAKNVSDDLGPNI